MAETFYQQASILKPTVQAGLRPNVAHFVRVQVADGVPAPIGDGRLHPLSDYYATLTAAQADYPAAISLNQTLAGVSIALACNSTQGISKLYITPGKYIVRNDIAPLSVSSDFVLEGCITNWSESSQAACIAFTDPTQDCMQVSSNCAEIHEISFTHHAGTAGPIASTTSTSITFDWAEAVYLATLTAQTLATGLQVYCYRIYTNVGNLYRMRTVGAGGATVGATLPTHSSGTVTIGGIAWEYFGAGTTYQRGQYSNTHVWWFHSVSGGITLNDVTPSDQSSTANPSGLTGLGYFLSLAFAGNDGSNNSGCLHFTAGNDSQVQRCWFLVAPGSAIKLDPGVQGGMWGGNVFDNVYYGMYGSFTNNRIFQNRFYNTTVGVKATHWSMVQDNGNYFQQCGLMYDIEDSGYSAALPLPGGGNCQWSSITDFHGDVCGKFAKLRGCKGLNISDGLLARNQNGPVLEIVESDSCQFTDILMVGAEEGAGTFATNHAYVQLSGHNYYHKFRGLKFQRVSGSEAVTTAFYWVDDYSRYSMFRDIDVDFAYSADNVHPTRQLESPRVGGALSNRPIATATLVPGVDPQVIRYTGNVSGPVVLTLARTGVEDGAFFRLICNNNVQSGGSIAVMQESDATPLLTVTTPDGSVNNEVWCFELVVDEIGARKWYMTARIQNGINTLINSGKIPKVGSAYNTLVESIMKESSGQIRIEPTADGTALVLVTPHGNLQFATDASGNGNTNIFSSSGLLYLMGQISASGTGRLVSPERIQAAELLGTSLAGHGTKFVTTDNSGILGAMGAMTANRVMVTDNGGFPTTNGALTTGQIIFADALGLVSHDLAGLLAFLGTLTTLQLAGLGITRSWVLGLLSTLDNTEINGLGLLAWFTGVCLATTDFASAVNSLISSSYSTSGFTTAVDARISAATGATIAAHPHTHTIPNHAHGGVMVGAGSTATDGGGGSTGNDV